jgi:hypothetical protein
MSKGQQWRRWVFVYLNPLAWPILFIVAMLASIVEFCEEKWPDD